MAIHVRSTPAQRSSDRRMFDSIFPGFNRTVDECAEKIEEAGRDLRSDAIGFRRLIIGSPYERLTLAGQLIDMCEEDAAELLNREIDPLTFDDVLASIAALAAKVRALKDRSELLKAAE